MLKSPFAPWPCYTEEEINAVENVLKSNRVNYWSGDECRLFESEFAAWAGTRFAIALANGTVALDLALAGLKIGAGDEVVVTPRTYIASASCIVNAGAVPIFADVDRESGNITAETISAVLTSRTRAIIVVHLAGWPCEMGPIMKLAQEQDLFVIEDCAQAHGAAYEERSVGSIGHVGAWSFCQDKIMTTGGEGGMVTTNDRDVWSRMWSIKDHGKSWSAVYERRHEPGFRWLHEAFGTNWRMTEMQAAIGRIQLQRLPAWHIRRQAIAMKIWSVASKLPGLRVPKCPEHARHAAYKCYLFVNPNDLRSGWDRTRIMLEINARGVPCLEGTCSEVYMEKAFESTNYRPVARLPIAKEMGETSLMLMCHPTLTDAQVDATCEALKSVMMAAASARRGAAMSSSGDE